MAGRHFWASQASSLAGAGRGGRAQHVRQLRLLSKNKRRTQRIVVEFESQGGQPTRIVHTRTIVDAGQGGTTQTQMASWRQEQDDPPMQGHRRPNLTTPDMGTSSSPPPPHLPPPLLLPSAGSNYPRRKTSSHPVQFLLRSAVVGGRGDLIKKLP